MIWPFASIATSNRLNSLTNPARSLSYDNAGNTTADTNSAYTATYDPSGRMSTLSKGGVTASYSYDGFDRRVRKYNSSGSGSTVVFAYDVNGQLLGEYDQSGAALREYVWLGSMPIALFMPDPTNPAGAPLTYYIHADHIDTPRAVLDAGNNLRWRWMAEPFGTTAPETNPASLGVFTQNLRFAGQYADAESGLSYNFFRDYDASTGRYVQSDPIGLQGGINTYAYVGGNPISFTDPTGLATAEEIRRAVATLRCESPNEFSKLANSIAMANMGENGAGKTDWLNNITLNSRLYGDGQTPVDAFCKASFCKRLRMKCCMSTSLSGVVC